MVKIDGDSQLLVKNEDDSRCLGRKWQWWVGPFYDMSFWKKNCYKHICSVDGAIPQIFLWIHITKQPTSVPEGTYLKYLVIPSGNITTHQVFNHSKSWMVQTLWSLIQTDRHSNNNLLITSSGYPHISNSISNSLYYITY